MRLVVGLLVAGCCLGCGQGGFGGFGLPNGDASSDDGGSFELTPFRDEWRTVHEGDFAYLAAGGSAQITDITIGGLLSTDNFANRGDVVVLFDGPEDRIRIEMRRFTMARNEDEAEEDFAATTLWAYANNTGLPRKPENMDEIDDCTIGGWDNGCEVRIYYDGQVQPARTGSDLRVTLPADYRHSIDIVTSDNDLDGDYFNRGNVCVQRLNGSADIDLEDGLAFVILAADANPIPSCSPADLATCEGWPDGSGSESWASACPCIATIGAFGQVRIDSAVTTSADATIDIPEDLWAAINVANEAEGQSADGDHCKSVVSVPNFELDENLYPNGTQDQEMSPWKAKGFLNHPSEAAVVGAGYSIQAYSSDCLPVAFTENPEDFVGRNMGANQELDPLRGDIEICAGCLAGQSCADLLP